MKSNSWYGRDVSLQMRMAFTMILLTFIYIVFAAVLFRFTRFGMFVFVIPLAGLFFQYYFSDKIVLSSVGARIVTGEQAPAVYSIIERLSQQADLPMPRVGIMNSPMPNAFATGRGPSHAVVVVTTGLLHELPPQELEAVLAHEMTHIRNRDMVVMTMAGSFAAVASWIVQMGFWFGLGDSRDDNRGGGLSFLAILLISLVVSIVSHILVMTLSRYREYAADRGAALMIGAPEQLQSALLRISGTMQSIPTRDLREAEPLAALFFASPTKHSVGQTVSEIFSDHPSVEKRVARLQQLSLSMAAR
ncbi:MAG: zinc metalloprotease HtpX [Chloroflexota bacterium]